MIKILIGFVLGVAVIILVPIFLSIFGPKTNWTAAEYCESLRLGMTKEQVKALVGEPRDTSKQMQTDLTEYEVWDYGISSGGSGSISASFDLKAQRLMEFSCEEDYFVGIDRENVKKLGLDSLLRLETNINSVFIGNTGDSVNLKLGLPDRKYSLFGKSVWQFNGLTYGNGRPTIVFDSASNQVISVGGSMRYFISEMNARELLSPLFSETKF